MRPMHVQRCQHTHDRPAVRCVILSPVVDGRMDGRMDGWMNEWMDMGKPHTKEDLKSRVWWRETSSSGGTTVYCARNRSRRSARFRKLRLLKKSRIVFYMSLSFILHITVQHTCCFSFRSVGVFEEYHPSSMGEGFCVKSQARWCKIPKDEGIHVRNEEGVQHSACGRGYAACMVRAPNIYIHIRTGVKERMICNAHPCTTYSYPQNILLRHVYISLRRRRFFF
jgi:hypothetical protein